MWGRITDFKGKWTPWGELLGRNAVLWTAQTNSRPCTWPHVCESIITRPVSLAGLFSLTQGLASFILAKMSVVHHSRVWVFSLWTQRYDGQFSYIYLTIFLGNSLVVQWLGLGTFHCHGPGSIPGRGTKILQATWPGQKQKTKKNTTNISS